MESRFLVAQLQLECRFRRRQRVRTRVVTFRELLALHQVFRVVVRPHLVSAQPRSDLLLESLQQQEQLLDFSDEMTDAIGEIRQFLFEHMYRAPTVMEMRAKTAAAVSDLFAAYMLNPALMPEDWRAEAFGPDTNRARVVADYIAGMTDRYALDAHARLPARACA